MNTLPQDIRILDDLLLAVHVGVSFAILRVEVLVLVSDIYTIVVRLPLVAHGCDWFNRHHVADVWLHRRKALLYF